MSNKKIEKMQKEYTKPQLTRWEQQKKRQRLILWGGIALIVVVVLGLFAAWFMEEQWQLYKTVITVNDQKITMNDYIKALRTQSQGATETELINIAYQTGNTLIYGALVSQGAAALNISVTDEEINTYLSENNKSKDWATFARTDLLQKKMIDEYFKPQVPTTAEQRDIEAMFLESDAQASQIRAELEAGASFSDLAAEYSLNDYSKSNKGAIGMHPQPLFEYLLGSAVPGEYAFASEAGSLSQPRPDADTKKAVGYWLIMVVEEGTGDNEGKINVRAMLLGSEEEANQVRADIVDNGQDFNTIANEKDLYNPGGTNGGLIGFISEDSTDFSTAFKDIAFSLAVGEISQPVKDMSQTTTGGFWLVKVVDSATNKEVSESDITTMSYILYNSWYMQEQAIMVLDNKLTYDNVKFALDKVIGK